MKKLTFSWVCVCYWLLGPSALLAEECFQFADVAAQQGLLPHVAAIRGHGAAWGDADGDGRLDLYVATFHTGGSKPNALFWNRPTGFQPANQAAVNISARGTGVIFADLDNDGDQDLYLGSMPAPPESKLALKEGHALAGNTLFRNRGDGTFENISAGNGACPLAFGGRSVCVLDYDGDSLLDILAGEEPVVGYNGSTTKSSRLFRNVGNMQFADVSQEAGLTPGIPGLGVAASDVNNDGWPDFFLAAQNGGNVLFLNNGQGRFTAAPAAPFAWPTARGDNMVCGVTFGDVNRDGWLDLVLAQHFETPWKTPVSNRLYVHRGLEAGVPRYEDVTAAVGLQPLPMKSPHVELQDFDNDGWPDLYSTIVKFAAGKPHPLIYKHEGVVNGLPKFRETTLAVNDFPTNEDRQIGRTGEFFEKMIRDRKITYSAPGPTGDYDNDGRLDMFLPSWWMETPSLLLHNETKGGHWLAVRLEAPAGVNRQGIGSRICVYPAGKIGDAAALLGCREMSVGFGYASGQPAITHFGLGDHTVVDVEVILPHGKGSLRRTNVAADQQLTIK
jgi:enediyne biosynthesis protein E4